MSKPETNVIEGIISAKKQEEPINDGLDKQQNEDNQPSSKDEVQAKQRRRASSVANTKRSLKITFEEIEQKEKDPLNETNVSKDTNQALIPRRSSRKFSNASRAGSMRKTNLFHFGSIYAIGSMNMFGPRPVLRYQPSYRLESKNPFNKERCIKVLRAIMEKTMESKEYDSKSAPSWCKAMSEDIKTQIKLLKFDRYKIVCMVTIGEKYTQDFKQVVRTLWDADNDGFASYFYDRPHIFAVGTVYALYTD